MAFTLLVNFEDLCAFVPNRSFISDPNGKPTECHVLLRDLQTKPADWDPALTFFEHFPHLEFDPKDREIVAGDGFGAPDKTDGSRVLYFFDREHVEVKPKSRVSGTGVFTPNAVVPVDGTHPTDSSEEHSMWWLVNMSSLNNHARRARGSLLQDPPSPDILAARCRISEGRLSTEGLTEDLWTVGADIRQIANRVIWKIDQIVDYVDIELGRFDGSGSRTLRLRPQAGASQVELTVRNSEKELFFGGAMAYPGPFDARLYYALASALAVPFSAQRVPAPLVPPAGGHGTCVPLGFSEIG